MTANPEISTQAAVAELKTNDLQVLLICLSGDWSSAAKLPSMDSLVSQLPAKPAGKLCFDASAVQAWDSLFVTWVLRLVESIEAKGVDVVYDGLPQGVQGLIRLANAVPERTGARRGGDSPGWLERIGNRVYTYLDETRQLLAFLGEVATALLRMLTGRARFRRSDLSLFIQQTGVDALPIVSLISILVGFILAFIGALQLAMFGAQVYVANLVGIAMVREMGAMMAAIIMAGRTGAAFSAQLGTMQVNEEIDAFKTLGIDPIEYLVLPRMLALTLMMPLLCIYADLLGIVGGMLVGISLFDISPTQYIEQTASAVMLVDIAVGIVKSIVFGVLIALAGCMKGIQCGRSASAVGEATTGAVVTAIVAIIVSDAVMTLIANALGV
ncbi:MAG: MlaE family lipid ABC transporter permease subunit [Gammaproteobacteria bacterium]|nr:MlaE family lipid ABC transporter permease subunit [Gammaproteobacteria bacterium]